MLTRTLARQTDPDDISVGSPPIRLALRRSKRARRVTIRILHSDGRIVLTLPVGYPLDKAQEFARSKEGWLRKHLARITPAQDIGWESEIPYLGVPHQLQIGSGRSATLSQTGSENTIYLPACDAPARKLLAFFKTKARDRLALACDHYSEKLGKSFQTLTLRDTKSRWGSCSSDGKLMFSWRLIMAPPEILDYVAAHEVAHLAHMDHSPRFWAQVAALKPDYQPDRNWLRQHGSKLHQWRFT